MGCSSFIVRNILFLFNFIFVVAGLGLLVLGIISKLNLDDVVPDRYNGSMGAAPILLIAIGSIVFFIAFLGCCGAIRESKCMLTTYAVIILLILVVQIAAGVIAFLHVKDTNGEFQKEIADVMKNTVNEYDSNTAAKEYLDLMQEKLECCGASGSGDYVKVPSSCCKDKADPCNSPFKRGCSKLVYDQMKTLSETIGKVALGLCCTELLTIVFSLCLVSSINNERRRAHV